MNIGKYSKHKVEFLCLDTAYQFNNSEKYSKSSNEYFDGIHINCTNWQQEVEFTSEKKDIASDMQNSNTFYDIKIHSFDYQNEKFKNIFGNVSFKGLINNWKYIFQIEIFPNKELFLKYYDLIFEKKLNPSFVTLEFKKAKKFYSYISICMDNRNNCEVTSMNLSFKNNKK